jgi:hypothetical protein
VPMALAQEALHSCGSGPGKFRRADSSLRVVLHTETGLTMASYRH